MKNAKITPFFYNPSPPRLANKIESIGDNRILKFCRNRLKCFRKRPRNSIDHLACVDEIQRCRDTAPDTIHNIYMNRAKDGCVNKKYGERLRQSMCDLYNFYNRIGETLVFEPKQKPNRNDVADLVRNL